MSRPASKPERALRYPFDKPPARGIVCEVAKGVMWLRMPLPFTLDHINLWILEDGAGVSVVDTGVSTKTSRAIWEEALNTYAPGKPLNRVIVTHMHPDHVGLAGWFVREKGAKLFMSRTDYLMCRTLAADTGRAAPDEALHFYRAGGFSKDDLESYLARFGFFGELIERMPDSYQRLCDGDTLSIGGRDWELVAGSGHAPEHMCLYCAEAKVFISGDQVLPRISSNVSVFPTEPLANPLGDWLSSCRNISKRVPDDVLVCPAHNEPFYGLHARLNGLIENHERALERLKALCDEAPRRAIDVFPALFRREVTGGMYMMAVGESIAHFNYLLNTGEMTVARDADGVDWYQPAGSKTLKLHGQSQRA